MAQILVIDDDVTLCEMMCDKLGNLGHATISANTLSQGLERVSSSSVDLVMLDVRLPDGSGLDALPQFKSSQSRPEIIIITGEGDPNGAKLALETGAWDYIEKPFSIREITLQVTRALEYRYEKTISKPARLLKRGGIIGSDSRLEACLEQVAQSAGNDSPVLITGETGTGKELFARAVHINSQRSSGPFVVVDCTALPENLVASILFGYRKGAFTGAEQDREGLILQANKGTLFMDEVGEMPIPVQKTFLRVLQERRLRRLSGKRERKSDFKLIAATNQDLEAMVRAGQFRKDLLFRLNATLIHLPPLKERKTDIEALALSYISIFCKRQGMSIKGVSQEFIQTLKAYTWPGNVRELVNVIDFAVSNAQEHSELVPMHLPVGIRVSLKQQSIGKSSAIAVSDTEADLPDLPSLKASLEMTERDYIETIMIRIGGDIKAACRISGLSRTGLYARLKKYKIKRAS